MKKLFLSFCLVFSIVVGSCQIQTPSPSVLGQVNISSPNSAALGKYVDVPVNYHTGVPNIGIPIYNVQSGNLSLPISLSYHASGLKVQEQASWVGAGWSLNAGGMITRSVIGLPDEKLTNNLKNKRGYLSDGGVLDYYLRSSANQANYNEVATDGNDRIFTGQDDGEPDLFTFNFAGQSGKFYIGDDKKPMIVPNQDLKIEYTYQPGSGYYNQYYGDGYARSIQAFKITIKDGTRYYFGIFDAQPATGLVYPIEIIQSYSFEVGVADNKLITGWYLYRVESADGANNIYLDYKRDSYATIQLSPISSQASVIENLNTGVNLSAIRFANGKVEFFDGIGREDLLAWDETLLPQYPDPLVNPTSKSLGKIKISDNSGNCKQFNLTQSFFIDNITSLPASIGPGGSGLHSDKKRLKLDAINEQSCNGTVSLPAYQFNYFSESVTRSVSLNMDHWGFINGATNNTDLIPAVTKNGLPFYVNGNLTNANRDPAWPAMRGGSLSSIIYPTGGQTIYEYEPNAVKVNNQDAMIGGLRIKKITQIDGTNTNPDIVTNFNYGNSDGFSSGVLYSRPTYIQILRNDIFNVFKLSQQGIFNNSCGITPFTTQPYIASRFSLNPLKTTQGNHVGYESVKVSKTNNGTTVFKYFVTESLKNINSIAITNINHDGTATDCSYLTPNYPPAPLKFDFLSGELRQESYYTQQGIKLKEKKYFPTYKIDRTKLYGIKVSSNQPFGSGGYFSTFYELSTVSKLQDIIEETDYTDQTSTPLVNTTTINYQSNFHFDPTNIIKKNSNGEIIETKVKYIKDFIAPSISSMQTDYASYNNFNLQYQRFTTDPNSLDYNLYLAIQNCVSQSVPWACRANLYFANYIKPVVDARRAWVNAAKQLYTNQNPLNTYQVLHNIEKSNAQNDWKALLWMQDVGINSPVEITNWKDGKLLNANYTSYRNYNNDIYTNYPYKQLQLKLNTPSINYTNASVVSNNIQLDSRYIDEATVKYDNGNIVEAIGKDGITTSYIWGYNNTLPIVKATGISYAVLKAAYDAVSGNLTSLRLQPSLSAAFINTYVYTVGVGITSETDANNKTKYYEYDSFNRLSLIRDQDNNILKKICYNYAGQVENCNSPCLPSQMQPNWQNTTTPPTCEQNICGNTGYQLQEQKDMNTCSPTNGTIRFVQVSNPTACPANTLPQITYQNFTNQSGYSATYTNLMTGQVFTFAIPASSSGTLGCIPAGKYSVNITKPNAMGFYNFGNGCANSTGITAYFAKVLVPACSHLTIDWEY